MGTVDKSPHNCKANAKVLVIHRPIGKRLTYILRLIWGIFYLIKGIIQYNHAPSQQYCNHYLNGEEPRLKNSNKQCCIKYFSKVFLIQVHVQVLSCKSILNTVENTVLKKYFKY